MERIEFIVRGSKGDHYRIAFEVEGTTAHAFCTCEAGANGMYCKHRFGILDGDITHIISGNTSDVFRLHKLLEGTELLVAYHDLVSAEVAYSAASDRRRTARRALAKAMYS